MRIRVGVGRETWGQGGKGRIGERERGSKRGDRET